MDAKIIQSLETALSQGNTKRALGLVGQLSDVEHCDPAGGYRSLHFAVRYHNLPIVQALLSKQADPNSLTILGSSPLKLAMKYEAPDEVIVALISSGARDTLTERYAHLAPGYAKPTQTRVRSPKPQRTKPLSQPSAQKVRQATAPSPVSQLLSSSPLKAWFTLHWPSVLEVIKSYDAEKTNKTSNRSMVDLSTPTTQLIDEIIRLQRSTADDPLAFLELSLRLTSAGVDFEEDASTALSHYEDALGANPELFHPVWLIAKATGMSPQASRSSSAGLGKALLKLYRLLCISTAQHLADEQTGPFAFYLQALRKRTAPRESKSSCTTQDRWENLEARLPAKWSRPLAPHMKELMGLIGMQSVKDLALDLIAAALAESKLDKKSRIPQTLNFALLGNPGTGKTTAARLLGAILHAIGQRRSEAFEEVTARQLMNDGLAELHELIKEADGGVLFVDEAYAFDPEKNERGREIFEELLVVAEQKRESISIFLAGYQRDMEQKLFSFNEGLQSRFTQILLEDFTESELRQIWRHELNKRSGWDEKNDLVGHVIARRLARRRGSRGFGNARDVRNQFERSARVTLSRLSQSHQQGPLVITLEDVIGVPPSRDSLPELDRTLSELESMTGQAGIKKRFFNLVQLAQTNHNRELRGERPHQVSLNRLFLGNPGTGKTTTARLYGRLLRSLGLLSNGEILERTASDLVGSHIGESQKKTRALLELAQGKVLLIDEAYSLNDSLYGKQALDTIVEQVSGSPGEDIAVVMCGYTREMEEMLRMQNPGLSRRFPRDQAFEFEDFNDDDLLLILKSAARRAGLSLSLDLAMRLVGELGRKRAIPHFGNAGEVQQRLSRAKERLAARVGIEGDQESNRLVEEDLFGEQSKALASPLLELEKLGVDAVTLDRFKKFEALTRVHERDGGSRPLLGHMQFIGNAGTGKTTVARLMGKLLHGLGVLARDHVEETSGLDLTGAFVGQTKGVVQEKLEAAAGGVLFIDEAYQLASGQYGSEAITTLVQLMTEPRYDRDKTIIILAGYSNEMAQLMRSNQGLASRFKNRVIFPDWTPERCLTLLKDLGAAEQLTIGHEAQEIFKSGCAQLLDLANWGNARDVKTLWDDARATRSLRVLDEPEEHPQLTATDLQSAVDTLFETRQVLMEAPLLNAGHPQLFPEVPLSQQAVEVQQAFRQEQQQEVMLDHHEDQEDQEDEEELDLESERAFFKEIQEELNAMNEEMKASTLLSKAQAGEQSFEAALERQLPDDPDLISDLPNRGIDDPSIQAALQEVIEQLIEQGMDPSQAQTFATKEVEKLLKHAKKTKRLQKKLEQRLKELEPIYACGACGRPWGTGWNECNFMGPVITGYRERSQ